MTQPTMPALLAQLADISKRMADHPPPADPALSLTSDRELSGTDEADKVTVTMKDFKVASVRVDPIWFETADRADVEDRVAEAVNVVLAQYLLEEFEAMSEAQTGIKDLHRVLREMSADATAAFTRDIDAQVARMARP